SFFPWPEEVALEAGSNVRVTIRADFVRDDYVWTWETDIGRPGMSALLARFIPMMSSGADIDRRILELLAQRLSVGQVASLVQAEFSDALDTDAQAMV